MLTLGTAIALAVSRLDTAFFVVVAFPIVFGPLGSFRVVVSVPSFVIGLLSSVFWTLVSVVPLVTIGGILYLPLLPLSKGPLMQDFLSFLGVSYFLAASYLGGYIGGTVARPD
jgi:hypothetical protein